MKTTECKIEKRFKKYIVANSKDLINGIIDLSEYGRIPIPDTCKACVFYKEKTLYKHKTKELYILHLIATGTFEIYTYAKDINITNIYREDGPAHIEIEGNKYYDSHISKIKLSEYNQDSGNIKCLIYHFNISNLFDSLEIENENNRLHYVQINRTDGIDYIIRKQYISENVKVSIYYGKNKKTIHIFDKTKKVYVEKHQFYIDDSKVTTYKYNIEPGWLHRLDGPSYIVYDKNPKFSWYINNIQVPEDIIKVNLKKCPNPIITRRDMLQAMLFNREYGTYIKSLYEQNKNIENI